MTKSLPKQTVYRLDVARIEPPDEPVERTGGGCTDCPGYRHPDCCCAHDDREDDL